MRAVGGDEVRDGWAGELASLFRRLRGTSGVDPTSGRPMSLRQVAKRAGYAPSHVRDVLNGVGRPSADAVGAVAGALGASDEDCRMARFYAEQLRQSPSRRQPDGGADRRRGIGRTIPRELPHDIRGFTGRADELARLAALVGVDPVPGAVVISAIDGVGGVGKTSLAIRFAHRIADRFPDGQIYVNLRGFDPHEPPLSPGEVLDRLLRSLGIDPTQIPATPDERARLYRSLMAGQRILLLLDNAASADQVRPLLPGSDTCLALVTSRNRLSGLVGDGAHRLTLGVLTEPESVALVAAIAGHQRVRDERDAAVELAGLCGRLPLALRIAAERLSVRSHMRVRDLVDDLSDERDRLRVLSGGDDDQMAVRTVFSCSYRQLPPAARRLFRLLALHVGPQFSTPVVAALADTTPGEAARLLDVLVGGNLVEQVSRDRYRLHDLVRVYAAERAAIDESDHERVAAVRRMLDWYLRAADATARVLMPDGWYMPLAAPQTSVPPPTVMSRADAVGWCETERINLGAAIRLAADRGEHAVAWKLAGTLTGFYYLRKHWADWTASHQVGLAAARHLNDHFGQAWILTSLAGAYLDQRRYREATETSQLALAHWAESGERSGESWVLANLGAAYLGLREIDKALDTCTNALQVGQRTQEPRGEALALLYLGIIYQHQGRYQDARTHTERAVSIWRTTGNRYGQAWSLNTLGAIHRQFGHPELALDCCRQALAIRREIGDRKGEATTLDSIGKALQATGDQVQARQAWSQALTIFLAIGDPKASTVEAQLATTGEEPDDSDDRHGHS
jgi:tetratricopeptide (TPR) repeat protein